MRRRDYPAREKVGAFHFLGNRGGPIWFFPPPHLISLFCSHTSLCLQRSWNIRWGIRRNVRRYVRRRIRRSNVGDNHVQGCLKNAGGFKGSYLVGCPSVTTTNRVLALRQPNQCHNEQGDGLDGLHLCS